jgi:hypothetical protein
MAQRLMRSKDWAEVEREVKKLPASLHRSLVEGQISVLKDFASSPAELSPAAAAGLEASVTVLYQSEPREGDVESIMRLLTTG